MKNSRINLVIKTVLITILIVSAFSMDAQITRQQADDIVTANVISDNDGCALYIKNDVVRSNDTVYTADGEIISHTSENSYIYFIDDNPVANWAHNCRYCVVDAATGSYSVENHTWYPTDFDSFTCLTEYETEKSHWPYDNYTIPEKVEPNGKLYAVLIGGELAASGQNPIKGWYNLSCVYTALVNNYGFMEATEENPSHILVLASDDVRDGVEKKNYSNYPPNNNPYKYNYDLNHSGILDCFGNDENDFMDSSILPYSKDGIRIIFDNLSGKQNGNENISFIPQLTEDDQLFVCLCGHGNTDGSMSYFKVFYEGKDDRSSARLYDYELAEWTRDIKCSQMTFMIDCCHSGGFIDDLMNDDSALCKNRAVHTCTNAEGVGYVEKHITDYFTDKGGPDSWQRVDEFVYYWSAASLGYYPILDVRTDSLLGPWHKYENTAIGEFPWQLFTSFDEGNHSHEGYDVSPDINRDGIVSMEEAFTFANSLDSYSEYGYFNSAVTQPGPDNPGFETPCESYESTFTKGLITLNGYKGVIDTAAETGCGRTYQLAGDFTIGKNASLTFCNGCTLNGNGFLMRNLGEVTTQSNAKDIAFTNTRIQNANSRGFTLSRCTFNDCGTVLTYDSPFSISNSIFSGTTIEANTNIPPRTRYNVNIVRNRFYNSAVTSPCIYLRKIPQCNVEYNTITGSGGDGIELNRLGGVSGDYLFSHNRIDSCAGSGIVAYNSTATLQLNCIMDNSDCGIKSLNLSNMQITGDSTARDTYLTQQILDNKRYQVYASSNSYPSYFKYNYLRGNGNEQGDTILYYEPKTNMDSRRSFDVSYNCWKPLSDSEIGDHLYTDGDDTFIFVPTWNPKYHPELPLPPQRMLESGDFHAANGEYDAAIDTYRILVGTYPESPEAEVALKSMFAVTGISDGDFTGLKTYYSGLCGDNALGVIADNLSNKCDVKLKNYSNAIEWYENKITDDSASFSDRIFAEIDLGELYLEMDEDGNGKGYTGILSQYKPTSKEAHAKHSRQLLSLLPHVEKQSDAGLIQSHTNVVTAEMSFSPNPVRDILNISLVENVSTAIDVAIYDTHGNMVIRKSIGCQQDGMLTYTVNLSDIPDGLYFCKVTGDNTTTNVCKIIVKH